MSAGWLTTAQETALAAWVRAATGLGADAVLWAPVADDAGREMPRPALPYVTLQVTTPPHDAYGQMSRSAVTMTSEDPELILFLAPVVDVLDTPPESPATGARYLAGTTPDGAWESHADELATWTGEAWTFETAASGDRVYVDEDSTVRRFDGDAWEAEDDTTIERVSTNRPFTLTINAYTRTDAGSVNASRLVDRCVNAMSLSRCADPLTAAGLGFVRVVSTRNLDALVSQSWESRSAADVVFHVAVVEYAVVDTIATAAGTGTVTVGSTPVTVAFGD